MICYLPLAVKKILEIDYFDLIQTWSANWLCQLWPLWRSKIGSLKESDNWRWLLIQVPSMMTSSNRNIFRVTEFTGHRLIPCTKASGTELWCFIDLRLNQQLSKKWRRRWVEMSSRSLWRHSNVLPNASWRLSFRMLCALLNFCAGNLAVTNGLLTQKTRNEDM